MTKFVCFLGLCLNLFSISFAQQNNPLINSQDVIDNGLKKYKEGKYKEAIDIYLQVSESDTNYSSVLNNLILAYYYDSNYVMSQKLSELGLKRFPSRAPEWNNLLANSLDNSGKKEEALLVYDKIIKSCPYNYIAWYNKGITYYRLNKFKEAKDCFYRVLLVNPYYSFAHYYLGKIEMEQGNLVNAMMSFIGNLMVYPGNANNEIAIKHLNSISEVNKEIIGYISKYKPSNANDFDIIQEILVSKVALDKGYKLKVKLEDVITRQTQVLMEKIEFNANDKGFYMQFYVPLLQKIYKDDLIEPFMFYLFSDIKIDKIQTYNNRNKKEIERVKNILEEYLNQIRESQTLAYNQRSTIKERFIISDFKVVGKGIVEKDEKGKPIYRGNFEFYHDNGSILAKGKFDNNGERTGPWEFYFDDGTLKERSYFRNGLADGQSEGWFDNAVMQRRTTYKDNKEHGHATSWYYNGLKREDENYIEDEITGDFSYYNKYGIVTSTGKFVDKKVDGVLKNFHPNGELSSIANFEKGVRNGKFTSYYKNGVIEEEGAFVNDKRDGVWKGYYESGKLSQLFNYISDNMEGEQIEYYENGKISKTRIFKNGKLEGKVLEYDDDGLVYCETIFEKNRLRDITFYDKKGNIISNTTSRKGNANIIFYDPHGNKVTEGYFTKEGLREGLFIFYYANGKKSAEVPFKNGMMNGIRTEYFLNGKKKNECFYVDDEADGYYKEWSINGVLLEEGWYKESKRQGTHFHYNTFGDLMTKLYFLNDKLYGMTEYYYPNGKKNYSMHLEYDWLKEITQFDSTGKEIAYLNMPQGNGKFEWKFENGKKNIDVTYKHFFKNGEYNVYYGNGKLNKQMFNKNETLDSVYNVFYENGKVKTTGFYKNGNPFGEWNYYYDNGQLHYQVKYQNGLEDGLQILYNEDGSKDKEMNYKNGVLDGPYKYFAENGILAGIFNYKKGNLVSYSYEDKDGKLVSPIVLKNGTGKINCFFKNGKPSITTEAELSMINGQRILYFNNGGIYVTGQRNYGADNGLKKVFYPNGNLNKEENYVNDILHGVVKIYHANGKLKSEENYYDGNKHGICKYYDSTGKLINSNYYYYDALLSIQ